MRIVAEYKCVSQGRDITVQVPFVFKSSSGSWHPSSFPSHTH